MRGCFAVVSLVSAGVGCGDGDADHAKPADAAVPPPPIDAQPDAPPDAACQVALLTGGTDVTTQGWKVIQQAPATLSNGADFVQLDTSTVKGSSSGGQLLLTLTDPAVFTPPFKLAIVMKIVSIAPHQPDPLDAAVAIMPGLTGAVGLQSEREQMISIESNKISFGIGTPSATVNLVDGAFHTYTVAVAADLNFTLEIDDQASPVLTRPNTATNGTFALGDQTNDAGFDSSLQIRSITKLCL